MEAAEPLFRPNPTEILTFCHSLNASHSSGRRKKRQRVAIPELEEDAGLQKIEQINEANTVFIGRVLEFASGKGTGFRFGELFAYLKDRDGFDLLIDNDLVFKSMLKLYDLSVIDIKAWKTQHDEVVANATGELDVSYCLYCIEYKQPDLYGVERIEIRKPDESLFEEEIFFHRGDALFTRRVSISDFLIEVSFG